MNRSYQFFSIRNSNFIYLIICRLIGSKKGVFQIKLDKLKNHCEINETFSVDFDNKNPDAKMNCVLLINRPIVEPETFRVKRDECVITTMYPKYNKL